MHPLRAVACRPLMLGKRRVRRRLGRGLIGRQPTLGARVSMPLRRLGLTLHRPNRRGRQVDAGRRGAVQPLVRGGVRLVRRPSSPPAQFVRLRPEQIPLGFQSYSPLAFT
ncbi:MAG TPA: hypothetical protein VIR57_11345, partial [Chloroflexota bacterium]